MKALQRLDDSSYTYTTRTSNVRISDAIQSAIENYFADLDGHDCGNLYELVISQVERPLLETVMQECDGNQTKASRILGLNRGTLRKKLKQYEML